MKPQFDRDIDYFRRVALKSIRTPLTATEGDIILGYEYFGGVTRPEVINVFEFYALHGPKMPSINAAIAQLLGQPSASYSPETIFSRGKFVFSDYRTRLLPVRAEKLILSSARYSMQLFGSEFPNLPTLGVEHNLEYTDDEPTDTLAASDVDDESEGNIA